MPTPTADAQAVLDFWFREAGSKAWFKKSASFDRLCRQRFAATHSAAALGECWKWRATPAGRCAEIIVLDQLSRNMYRNDARAFGCDAMALTLAQWAVACGDDARMTADERYFTYMPYMHSESLRVHDEAVRLFEALGNEKALAYEYKHRDVLRQFGRYPGRNAALGRISTARELAFLDAEGGF